MAEDPYGTVAFVRFGVERGELRRDLDQEMMVSILDWTIERFQDALLTEELDPGLFRRQGDPCGEEGSADRAISGPAEAGHRIGALNCMPSLENILASYNDRAPLAEASTIPAPWYVDSRIADLEAKTVFSKSWQMVGRIEQVEKPGQFVTANIAGEPIVAVRGNDGVLRAFYNVCRHHAAAVVTEPCGQANILHCPYHGWNYGLDGSLKGMPEFDGVKDFERQKNGLVPVKAETWEKFVFVNLDPEAVGLREFLGGLVKQVAPLGVSKLHYFDSRSL